MTYPIPVLIMPAQRTVSMTPKEEDAYYETHAEPVPRWIRAPFILAGRILAALDAARADRPERVPSVPPAVHCSRQA